MPYLKNKLKKFNLRSISSQSSSSNNSNCLFQGRLKPVPRRKGN